LDHTGARSNELYACGTLLMSGAFLNNPQGATSQRCSSLFSPLQAYFPLKGSATMPSNTSLFIALGFPYDSSLNVVRLIQSGLFDEVPDLKVIVSHVGGVLPYLLGRLEVYTAPSPLTPGPSNLLHPLGHYVRNLYVDTVCYHPAALACCHAVMGAQHMLYGTDHPFGRPDPTGWVYGLPTS